MPSVGISLPSLDSFGLPGSANLNSTEMPKQPHLGSVGIKVPAIPKAKELPNLPGQTKSAFNVGMGASTPTSGTGAVRGEPADTGRRQRSVIDRTFQANEDNFATSSMPLPGDVVSP